MSEKDKKIAETISKLLPHLTEAEKEKFLAFGEGMTFTVNQRNKTASSAARHST